MDINRDVWIFYQRASCDCLSISSSWVLSDALQSLRNVCICVVEFSKCSACNLNVSPFKFVWNLFRYFESSGVLYPVKVSNGLGIASSVHLYTTDIPGAALALLQVFSLASYKKFCRKKWGRRSGTSAHMSNVIRLNVGKAPPTAMPQCLAPTHNQILKLANDAANGELWRSWKVEHPTMERQNVTKSQLRVYLLKTDFPFWKSNQFALKVDFCINFCFENWFPVWNVQYDG